MTREPSHDRLIGEIVGWSALLLVVAGVLVALLALVGVGWAQQPPQSVEDRLDQCTVNLGQTLSENGRLNYETRKLKERISGYEAAEKARKETKEPEKK